MATRIYYYEESLARTTTTTTNYSAIKVTRTFLPNANKTYAFFWSVVLDNSGSTNNKQARLRNTTSSTTLAENIMESLTTGGAATDKILAGGVALYTAPASPVNQTIQIQYASGGVATTVGAQEATLLILELIDSVDIWVSSTGVSTGTTTSYVSKITLSWTPATAGDYLILGSLETANAGQDPRDRLYVNSTNAYNEQLTRYSGTSGNYYPYVASVTMTNISGANTAAFQYASVSTGNSSHRNAYAVALRIDEFDAHFWGEDRTAHTTTSATYADSATTGAVTPVAQPHIVFAVGQTSTNNNTSSTGFKINGAGSDIGTNFIQNVGWGGVWWSCFQLRAITPAASSQTWKLQYARTTGSDICTSDENVVALLQFVSEGVQEGQPYVKRLGAIPYMTQRVGIW